MNLQSTVWVTSSTALNLQSPVNSSGTLGVRRPPPSSTHSDSDSDPNKSQNLTCVQNLSNQDSHIRKQTVPKFTHYAQERAFEDTPVELVQSVHRFALCGLYSSAFCPYSTKAKNMAKKHAFGVICVSAQGTSTQDGLLRDPTVIKVTHFPQITKFLCPTSRMCTAVIRSL